MIPWYFDYQDIAILTFNKCQGGKYNRYSPFGFNFEDYLKGMENHPRRDLQIIAFYFRETKTTYDSKEKASKGVARWLKVAQHLKPFSHARFTVILVTTDKNRD